MSDVRVAPMHESGVPVTGVTTNGSGGRRGTRDQPPRRQRERAGAEELALALHESGRRRLRAHFSIDDAGHALVQIIDHDRDEVVAVLTPEQLRELAEQTGLPPGLLVQTSS